MKCKPIVYNLACWFLVAICGVAGLYFIQITHNFSLLLPLAAITIAAIWSNRIMLKLQQQKQALLNQNNAAELAVLRAEVNPQILHDTLAHLHKMAYPIADDVAHAITQLTQHLQFIFPESHKETIMLQQEINGITNYIDLYRIRYPNGFFVNFEVKGDMADQQIEPLVLLPLVSFILNTAVLNDVQRPVKIQLSLIGNRLDFVVSSKANQGEGTRYTSDELVRVRRKLELVYPERHEILIADNGQSYKVTLIINL
jgi:LytS/YehU family sensor histidine kinase